MPAITPASISKAPPGARSANGTPLEPEESRQAEVGLRLRTSDFSGSLALFEVERMNALTTDPLNPNFSLNVGEQLVRGFELEGTWQAMPGWAITGGYAYLDSEITRSNNGDQGKRIGDVPAHSVTLSTDVAIPGTELTVRGGVNYVSDRLLVNGSNTSLPDYALVHLGAGYQLGRVSLNLTVNNLFNERYFHRLRQRLCGDAGRTAHHQPARGGQPVTLEQNGIEGRPSPLRRAVWRWHSMPVCSPRRSCWCWRSPARSICSSARSTTGGTATWTAPPLARWHTRCSIRKRWFWRHSRARSCAACAFPMRRTAPPNGW